MPSEEGDLMPRLANRAQFRTSLALVATVLTAFPNSMARAGDKSSALLRVTVATARRQHITPDLPLTGTIQARILSNIAFQTSGRVVRRDVEVGQYVKAGQTLAHLERTEQQTDVTSAEAALNAANAQLLEAQRNFERQQSLLSSGSTTRERFDQALATLRTDEAQVNSAQAALNTARERLTYTELKAGRDGIIVSRSIEVGQVVQAGQTAFALAEDGPRDAVFQVPEILVTNPPNDRTVDITSQSMPNVTVAGSVREISPILDQATGTVTLKVAVERAPADLTLGSAVVGRARWELSPAFVIPSSALFAANGKPAVWILDSENKARLRGVVVQEYLTGAVALAAGLEEGERVVTSSVQLLYPGKVVAVAYGAEP
ncbi:MULTISPECIES: efflux RND transporter periplasmic adaptor subunit [Bradyrhizobium]|nr:MULTISPECIES: efflux RND transporter periplasmic adaptor subunit [Bradyrhizobium]MCG2670336.1 efflux RND transporter periplasmic adaptor subunit [Bradyrhizobium zhengyangense]MDN5002691.1 efflux RND transporter periplasmic adaptor subunit [Bradyrhizobium sp. WYCCWR 12677]MDT4736771.1 efflux RND transporter periplasmic adaptor subunit [Bradyrhizobium sp. WYCCWR 12699]